MFSETNLENIEKVILDYQSRTSVELCKILFKHYWNKEVEFIYGSYNFTNEIKGTTAGIVIGDRAFEKRLKYDYVFDLAEAWIDFTKFPFVFAAWVANKKIDETFIEAFNKANAFGLENIEKVVETENYNIYNLQHYFTQNISYILNDEKRKGLQLFLEYLNKK